MGEIGSKIGLTSKEAERLSGSIFEPLEEMVTKEKERQQIERISTAGTALEKIGAVPFKIGEFGAGAITGIGRTVEQFTKPEFYKAAGGYLGLTQDEKSEVLRSAGGQVSREIQKDPGTFIGTTAASLALTLGASKIAGQALGKLKSIRAKPMTTISKSSSIIKEIGIGKAKGIGQVKGITKVGTGKSAVTVRTEAYGAFDIKTLPKTKVPVSLSAGKAIAQSQIVKTGLTGPKLSLPQYTLAKLQSISIAKSTAPLAPIKTATASKLLTFTKPSLLTKLRMAVRPTSLPPIKGTAVVGGQGYAVSPYAAKTFTITKPLLQVKTTAGLTKTSFVSASKTLLAGEKLKIGLKFPPIKPGVGIVGRGAEISAGKTIYIPKGFKPIPTISTGPGVSTTQTFTSGLSGKAIITSGLETTVKASGAKLATSQFATLVAPKEPVIVPTLPKLTTGSALKSITETDVKPRIGALKLEPPITIQEPKTKTKQVTTILTKQKTKTIQREATVAGQTLSSLIGVELAPVQEQLVVPAQAVTTVQQQSQLQKVAQATFGGAQFVPFSFTPTPTPPTARVPVLLIPPKKRPTVRKRRAKARRKPLDVSPISIERFGSVLFRKPLGLTDIVFAGVRGRKGDVLGRKGTFEKLGQLFLDEDIGTKKKKRRRSVFLP